MIRCVYCLCQFTDSYAHRFLLEHSEEEFQFLGSKFRAPLLVSSQYCRCCWCDLVHDTVVAATAAQQYIYSVVIKAGSNTRDGAPRCYGCSKILFPLTPIALQP